MMTTSKPSTAELAQQMVSARAEFAAAIGHIEAGIEAMRDVQPNLPTAPEWFVVESAIADGQHADELVRNASLFQRNAIWSLGGQP